MSRDVDLISVKQLKPQKHMSPHPELSKLSDIFQQKNQTFKLTDYFFRSAGRKQKNCRLKGQSLKQKITAIRASQLQESLCLHKVSNSHCLKSKQKIFSLTPLKTRRCWVRQKKETPKDKLKIKLKKKQSNQDLKIKLDPISDQQKFKKMNSLYFDKLFDELNTTNIKLQGERVNQNRSQAQVYQKFVNKVNLLNPERVKRKKMKQQYMKPKAEIKLCLNQKNKTEPNQISPWFTKELCSSQDQFNVFPNPNN